MCQVQCRICETFAGFGIFSFSRTQNFFVEMEVMINFRSGVAAVAILGAMLSAPVAHATPVSSVAFNDVGFGNLTGPGHIDGETAVLNAKLKETSPGLTDVNSVVETLGGHSFTLTQHGSQVGTGDAYLAGFTFNVAKGTDIAVTNVTPGVSYVVVKDKNSLGTGAFPASISGIGTPVASYANLAAGKYTLFLQGVVDLALNGSSTVSATISAVPLPGSLVMFGSALIGLTAFGARRRAGVSA